MTALLRCGPPITRSIASSMVSSSIFFLSSLAAKSAASFSTFARSAPVKPGVLLATRARSTLSASGLFLACTARICSRPFRSGALTPTCRSKRPGLSSAGSKTSGRLVAAIKITLVEVSKPSISTSSWFSVCSRSSLPPPIPVPR